MMRHGADMLWKVGTYEEIEGERKERRNEGDTGRRIETYIFTYKHAHTYKHASHTTVTDFLHRFFTAPTLLHTIVICAQKLLHRDAFTHKHFIHKHICTQTLLHTNSFTHKHHKHFYTQSFYTQTLLHADAFTHRPFHTQTNLHTIAFTHKNVYTQTLYTQTLLHTNTFTHNPCTHTQTLLHTNPFAHTDFYTQTSFRAKRLPPDPPNSPKTFSFWYSNLVSCERVAAGPSNTRKKKQLFTLKPRFVRKGCRTVKAQFYFFCFWHSNPISCGRVAAGPSKLAKTFSFWHSKLVSCESVAAGPSKPAKNWQFLTLEVAAEDVKSQFHLSFLTLESHFVRKGCRRTIQTRTSFREKGLPRTL